MRKYRVTGPTNVLGHAPGDVFEAEIRKSQEQRLIASGHLEVVVDKPKAKADKAEDAESNEDNKAA